jgi:hypothetical protein
VSFVTVADLKLEKELAWMLKVVLGQQVIFKGHWRPIHMDSQYSGLFGAEQR